MRASARSYRDYYHRLRYLCTRRVRSVDTRRGWVDRRRPLIYQVELCPRTGNHASRRPLRVHRWRWKKSVAWVTVHTECEHVTYLAQLRIKMYATGRLTKIVHVE